MSLSSTSNVGNANSQAVAGLVVGTGFQAATGALAAHFFTRISIPGGALFGAVEFISSVLISAFVNSRFGNSEVEKVAKFILRFFGSLAIACAVLAAAGFWISFEASIILSLLMIPTAIITAVAFNTLRILKD